MTDDYWKQYGRAKWGDVEFPEWRPIEFKTGRTVAGIDWAIGAHGRREVPSPSDIATTGYEVTDAPQLEPHAPR